MDYVISLVYLLCQVLTMLILARAILSWLLPDNTGIMIKIIRQTTEPILAPLRRIIPRVGRFDLSPIAAIILLQVIIYLLTLI